MKCHMYTAVPEENMVLQKYKTTNVNFIHPIAFVFVFDSKCFIVFVGHVYMFQQIAVPSVKFIAKFAFELNYASFVMFNFLMTVHTVDGTKSFRTNRTCFAIFRFYVQSSFSFCLKKCKKFLKICKTYKTHFACLLFSFFNKKFVCRNLYIYCLHYFSLQKYIEGITQ